MDFYLTLEAANDVIRETLEVDEVSKALASEKTKRKRKLGNFTHFAVIGLCLLLQVALVLTIPLATLTFRDVNIERPLVDFIKEIAVFDGNNKNGAIDIGKCLENGSKVWTRSDPERFLWSCKVEDDRYSLFAYDSSKKDDFDDAYSIDEFNSSLVSVSILIERTGMVKLKEGHVKKSEQNATYVSRLQIQMVLVNATYSPKDDCLDENRIIADPKRFGTDPHAICTCAIIPDSRLPDIARGLYIQQYFVKTADRPEPFALFYDVEPKDVARAVAFSERGNIRSVFFELSRKIAFKTLNPKMLEHSLNAKSGSRVIIQRKVISNTLVFSLVGVLAPLLLILKLFEIRHLGSESDRSKFRRTLAALKGIDLTSATSYELQTIKIRGLQVLEDYASCQVEYQTLHPCDAPPPPTKS